VSESEGTSRSAAEGVKLRWTDAAGGTLERPVGFGDVTIGRGAGCTIVIDDPTISRVHVRLTVTEAGISVEDLGSRNGTLVNGERIASTTLRSGDRLTLGSRTLELIDASATVTRLAISADGVTMIEPSARGRSTVMAAAPADGAPDPPEPTGIEALLQSPIVSERALHAAGMGIAVTDVLALGSGLGSFVFVDALRVSGLKPEQIVVVGNEPTPYSRYQRLCENSQIPARERLRSNSDSCPDNVWGFPGYAVREMWGNLRRGELSTTASVLWSIFGESAIADTYTPRSGDVFTNVAREAARIGWSQMLRHGRIRVIRKTDEGRILAIASTDDAAGHRRYAVSAHYVHLALGYPAIQLLPDLAEYRERTNDRTTVVNAYEDHAGIYARLRAQGGTVVLRGRGIVASRVLQRLFEERRHNANITVIHLHRSRLQGGRRYGWSHRKVDGEFEFQAFNWPKGCWTGPQRYTLEAATPDERKRLLDLWGGTTTANRSDWRRIVREGLRDGWYRQEYGVVRDVSPAKDGQVALRIAHALAGGGVLELLADYVIDCTGLVASPERAPVLDDLIETYGLARNPLGRFHVTNDFEIPGMRHGGARMFAAGASTLGGPFATVDSFLGLQYAGLRAVDAIAKAPPEGMRRLAGFESVRQWVRWARREAP
jgi:pSer/pThr/pTyr-binding forkhead associated (FHA) protein